MPRVYVDPPREPPPLQESSNDVSISADNSRRSLKVSGAPTAVAVCRKELYIMLEAAFRGQYHVVSALPRRLGGVRESVATTLTAGSLQLVVCA